MRIEGLGSRVQGLRSGVWDLKFSVYGFGCWVQSFVILDHGSGLRISGFRVEGFLFRVEGIDRTR